MSTKILYILLCPSSHMANVHEEKAGKLGEFKE